MHLFWLSKPGLRMLGVLGLQSISPLSLQSLVLRTSFLM